MAVNPKTQMVKLAIGAVTVSSVVGVTGWLWQTTHPVEASTAAAGGDGQVVPGQASTPQGGQSQPGSSATGTGAQRRRQSGQGFGSAQSPQFAAPGTQPSQRTRSGHS